MMRCEEIAGKSLGELAARLDIVVPDDLRRHKGWVGTLIESCLGADAGSRAQPDFVGLNIELKTLPLNAQGLPKESTYVCTVSMQQGGADTNWEQSWLRQKLSRVLWVPVEAEPTIPLAQRYVGQAWLWRPSPAQEAQLKRDWNELMDRIVLGEQFDLTAKEGEYLQIRPKAAHSRVMARGTADDGSSAQINPKGFYLRTSFTRQLLADI